MAARASVGIISIGEMGLGVANLLRSQNYRVITNVSGRSSSTHQRAEKASIILVSTDAELVAQADYILSIVPPRDSLATAQRIIEAQTSKPRPAGSLPLYYLDLNAISPSSAKEIDAHLSRLGDAVRHIDGGIIGGPPRGSAEEEDYSKWQRPSIVLSGPHLLKDAPKSGSHLADVLRTKHVGADIGTASGLKCCYASLTKGFTALAIQSFSTAARLGVLDELRDEIKRTAPQNLERASRGIVGMAPKSGRWVAEMHEIGKTFRESGGWQGATSSDGAPGGVFDQIAEVYRYVSDETALGEEQGENRQRGKTVDDAIAVISESRKSLL